MEDPLAVRFLLPHLQNLHRAGRKLDGSDTFFGFRFSNFHTAALAIADCPPDLKPPGLFIEVLPLEAADLAPAQSGGQLRVEEVRPHIVLPHHIQKLLELSFR